MDNYYLKLLFNIKRMLMNTLSDLDLKRSIRLMRKKSTIKPTRLIDTKARTTHACSDSKSKWIDEEEEEAIRLTFKNQCWMLYLLSSF